MDSHVVEPDYERWQSPLFTYSSLQAFLSIKRIPAGIHAINVNGLVVDFLFRRKTSDNLLVFFGGATRRGPERTPPFFFGTRLSAKLDCSVLSVNDPSFYLDPEIRLAWYAGSDRLPLQSILPRVIDKVASSCASRIIMTGGSGGGFASLYYSTTTSHPSIAFVYNPQTNISKYYRGHVQDYARVCFGWDGGDVESAFSDITFDLARHYSERKAPTIYLQNRTDSFHIQNHATPFLKAYGLEWTGTDQTAEGLHIHVGNWGDHHIVPPKELVGHIIRQLCAREVPFSEVVSRAQKEMAGSQRLEAERESAKRKRSEATSDKPAKESEATTPTEQDHLLTGKVLELTGAPVSRQLRSVIVPAFRTPGRNALLLPYRVIRLFLKALKRKSRKQHLK